MTFIKFFANPPPITYLKSNYCRTMKFFNILPPVNHVYCRHTTALQKRFLNSFEAFQLQNHWVSGTRQYCYDETVSSGSETMHTSFKAASRIACTCLHASFNPFTSRSWASVANSNCVRKSFCSCVIWLMVAWHHEINNLKRRNSKMPNANCIKLIKILIVSFRAVFINGCVERAVNAKSGLYISS